MTCMTRNGRRLQQKTFCEQVLCKIDLLQSCVDRMLPQPPPPTFPPPLHDTVNAKAMLDLNVVVQNLKLKQTSLEQTVMLLQSTVNTLASRLEVQQLTYWMHDFSASPSAWNWTYTWNTHETDVTKDVEKNRCELLLSQLLPEESGQSKRKVDLNTSKMENASEESVFVNHPLDLRHCDGCWEVLPQSCGFSTMCRECASIGLQEKQQFDIQTNIATEAELLHATVDAVSKKVANLSADLNNMSQQSVGDLPAAISGFRDEIGFCYAELKNMKNDMVNKSMYEQLHRNLAALEERLCVARAVEPDDSPEISEAGRDDENAGDFVYDGYYDSDDNTIPDDRTESDHEYFFGD